MKTCVWAQNTKLSILRRVLTSWVKKVMVSKGRLSAVLVWASAAVKKSARCAQAIALPKKSASQLAAAHDSSGKCCKVKWLRMAGRARSSKKRLILALPAKVVRVIAPRTSIWLLIRRSFCLTIMRPIADRVRHWLWVELETGRHWQVSSLG